MASMHAMPPSQHTSSRPPEAWGPLVRLARSAGRPLERFLEVEAGSGILLLLSAAAALIWANSPWAASYTAIWHTPVGVRFGELQLERPIEWVVNDGLMVIFFFVVGLEIRRELQYGELSEWRRASLPAAAALGGMVAPALIYLSFAPAANTRHGWGVPTATDIAFAVGALALLGKRVPPALRVLLLALAVIDDLGAIVVIALFYSSGIAVTGLLVAALGIAGIFFMQRLGVRAKAVYVAPGLIVWAGIYSSGVHPTIAGVIIGMITPVRVWLGPAGFIERLQRALTPLRADHSSELTSDELSEAMRGVDRARREVMSPAESLIETLHPWVAYVIMPVFALANAGVSLRGLSFDPESTRVLLGVAVGLVAGKPIGVLLAIGLTLKLGIGALPRGLGPRHLVVLGVVAGIGFTMALFVAQLAFDDPKLLSAAKLGALCASAVAAVLATLLGRIVLRPVGTEGSARNADEAERSTLL
jgi:NhaA family Na+:H+ antiporter